VTSESVPPNIERSKVTWKQILTLIAEYGAPVKTVMLQADFQRSSGSMGKTLSRLHVWGYIKYADRSKRGWGGYIITESGMRRVKEWTTSR